MTEKAALNRMMVPCYLNLDEYLMFKALADNDMRTMSSMVRVLIHREASEQGIDIATFAEAAEKLHEERKIKFKL